MTKNKSTAKVVQLVFPAGSVNCYTTENFLRAASIAYETIKGPAVNFKTEEKAVKFLQEINGIDVNIGLIKKFDTMKDYELVQDLDEKDEEIIARIFKSAVKLNRENVETVENLEEVEIESKEATEQQVDKEDKEDEEDEQGEDQELPEGVEVAVQTEKVICSNCAKECILDAEQLFCDNCGEKLLGQEQEEKRIETMSKRRTELQLKSVKLQSELESLKKLEELVSEESLEALTKYFSEEAKRFIDEKEHSKARKAHRVVTNIEQIQGFLKDNSETVENIEFEIQKINETLENFQLELPFA